ncbi:MAG: PDZ domain-containing protein [Candidatus Niyogibacteria bacterium]|nr:PDZ domain-containing protein [Candidatus Niyogibacteria bacterium]
MKRLRTLIILLLLIASCVAYPGNLRASSDKFSEERIIEKFQSKDRLPSGDAIRILNESLEFIAKDQYPKADISAFTSKFLITMEVMSGVNLGSSNNFGGIDERAQLIECKKGISLAIEKLYLKFPNTNILEFAKTAFNKSLEENLDKYASLVSPDEDAEEYYRTRAGIKFGIGVIHSTDGNGRIIVYDVFKNSPAAKAGINKGDETLEINGKKTIGLALEEARKIIKDSPGDAVYLKVKKRNRKEIFYNIHKDFVLMPVVSTAIFPVGSEYIGYVRFRLVIPRAVEEFARFTRHLATYRIRSLIIDYRECPGGLRSATDQINRTLGMQEGEPMSVVISRTGQVVDGSFILESVNRPRFFKKIIILIDNGSASATERSAAALRYNLPAETVVMGEKSYGKGIGQHIHLLHLDYILRHTDNEFRSPDNRVIHGIGIEPDVKITNSPDPNLLNAYPSIDKEYPYDYQLIRAVDFIKNNYLEEIKRSYFLPIPSDEEKPGSYLVKLPDWQSWREIKEKQKKLSRKLPDGKDIVIGFQKEYQNPQSDLTVVVFTSTLGNQEKPIAIFLGRKEVFTPIFISEDKKGYGVEGMQGTGLLSQNLYSDSAFTGIIDFFMPTWFGFSAHKSYYLFEQRWVDGNERFNIVNLVKENLHKDSR